MAEVLSAVTVAWLAVEATPETAWSVFAQYGVVGALAFGGLWFAWRVYRVVDAERVGLLERNRELNGRMLTLVVEHKDELLKTYSTVMPTMVSAVDALKAASQLIEEYRRQQERDRRG